MKRYEDAIKELFNLSLEVHKKTDAFVEFNISNNGSPACGVMIMHNGFDKDRGFDGFYYVWPDDIAEYVSAFSDYGKAVAHLKRLIWEADKAGISAGKDDEKHLSIAGHPAFRS